MEVGFEIPRLNRGERKFAWGVPQTAATLLALTLPDERTRAEISPGGGVVERAAAGKTQVLAALGTTSRVEVELRAAEAVQQGQGDVRESTSATITQQVLIQLGREEVRAHFEFALAEGRVDRFTIFLEKGLTLFDLEAPNLKSWRLYADGPRQALELILAGPAEGTFTCRLAAERPLPSLPAEVKTPDFGVQAQRLVFAGVELAAASRLTVAATPGPLHRQIPETVSRRSLVRRCR